MKINLPTAIYEILPYVEITVGTTLILGFNAFLVKIIGMVVLGFGFYYHLLRRGYRKNDRVVR